MLIIEILFIVFFVKNISIFFFIKYVIVRRMVKIVGYICRLYLFFVFDGGIEKGNKVRKFLLFGYLIMFLEKEL